MSCSPPSYFLSDHLGSTTLTVGAGGNAVAELRYKPWGETRLAGGTTLSKYQFSGQYSNVPEFGLYYFNARWYDPYNTHFTSPDTVIADNYQTLDYDRYAYARSNPVRYTDPSGHRACGDGEKVDCKNGSLNIKNTIKGTGCGIGKPRCQGATTFLNNNEPKYLDDGNDPNNELMDLLSFSKYGKMLIEIMGDISNIGEPIYKQVKAGVPYGWAVEGVVGASFQVMSDINRTDLNGRQIGSRGLIVGGENILTDLISSAAGDSIGTPAGVALAGMLIPEGGPISLGAGGVAGKYVAQYFTSIGLDMVWQNQNHTIFLNNGLGSP